MSLSLDDFYGAPHDAYVTDDDWLVVDDEAWTLAEWTREHPRRGPVRAATPAAIAEVVRRHHRGETIETIAEAMNLHPRTISRYLRTAGVRPDRTVLECPECRSTCIGARGLAAHRRSHLRDVA